MRNMEDVCLKYSTIDGAKAFGCAQMLCVAIGIIGEDDPLTRLPFSTAEESYLSFCFKLVEQAQRCREEIITNGTSNS
eukprot:gnl/Chilomastix_caulleri/4799.p1 GENE.gnl/Chilomastix_caulleri/4799~~gnl/Chilomastix_caulleri/4799.p1  ORF type:complete len:78 (+),score=19.64 gnl/Chilomastix_caulleri/4799:145-378(+)